MEQSVQGSSENELAHSTIGLKLKQLHETQPLVMAHFTPVFKPAVTNPMTSFSLLK